MATYRGGFETCPVDGATLAATDADPLIGVTIADQYVVDRCVGEGAMGRVYLAHHARLKRRKFAMKVLLGDLAADPTMRLRFAQEAEAASRLQHPNVVPVLDFGKTDGELHYLVMDFIEGGTLSDHIEKGALSEKESIDIAIQICQGLTHAHDQGLVHRDFKPDNVALVQRDGRSIPQILDFGLAIISTPEETSVRLTSAGLVVGTPAYVSPEQCQGKPVDLGTDLFAFGVSLYEMVSGVLPFDGSIIELLYKNAMEEAPSILERSGVQVSPALEAIIMRLMAKARDDRFASAREVLVALEAIDAPAETVARVAGAAVAPQEPVDKAKLESAQTMVASTQIDGDLLVVGAPAASIVDVPNASAAPGPGEKSSGRGPLIGAGLTLLVAAAVAALFVFGGSKEGEVTAPDTGLAKSDTSVEEIPTPVAVVVDAGVPEPLDTQPVLAVDAALKVADPVKVETKERRPPRDKRPKDTNKPEVAVAPPKDKDPPPPPPVEKPKDPVQPVVTRPVEVPKDPPKPIVVKPKVPTSFKAGISFSDFKATGSLSSRVTKKAVDRGKAALLACYAPAARANKKNATVSIRVNFEFDETGLASRVNVTEGKSLPGVASCVENKVKKLKLKRPPDTGTQRVTFVVKYTPKR
jgi:serine/threonine-protein kinase